MNYLQEAAAKRAAAKKLQHAAMHADDTVVDTDEAGGDTKGSVNGGYSQDSLDDEGVGGPDSAAPPEEHATLGDEADPEQSSAGHAHCSDEHAKGRLPFGEGKRHLNGLRTNHDESSPRVPRDRSPGAGDRHPQRNAAGDRGTDQANNEDFGHAHIKAESEHSTREQEERERIKAEAERKAREQEERERLKAEEEQKAKEQEERERLKAEAGRRAKEAEERQRLAAEEERRIKEAEERERQKVEADRKAKEVEERERLKAEEERRVREQEERERLKAEAERKAREQEERERLKGEADRRAKEIEERERLKAEEERKAKEVEERERLKAEADRKAKEAEERERLKAEADRKAKEQQEGASRHSEADTVRSSDLRVKVEPPAVAGGAYKAPGSPGMSSPASPKDAFAERKAALLAEAGSMKRGDEDDLRRKVRFAPPRTR
jgi:hypothetical protein